MDRAKETEAASGRKGVQQAVISAAPPAPRTIAETGVSETMLRTLVLKLFFVLGLDTVSAIAEELKLSRSIVSKLVEDGVGLGLFEVLGLRRPGETASELRYTLTDRGRQWTAEALAQSQYVGPAPVSLQSFRERVEKQRIATERLSRDDLYEAFSDLILPEKLVHLIGPAANSGRSILLFGGTGNGKTSMAEGIGRAFRTKIFVPYCIEVDSHIIRIFDSSLHRVAAQPSVSPNHGSMLHRAGVEHDSRWIACDRPVVMTGGELTLGMLDLAFNPVSKFYEAPMQLKATGGVFVIDDFGRQLVSPVDVLNRWIIPLERGRDYLTLHTGKKFEVPFDELVIFSTNLPPANLMDAATMRRIFYKIEVPPPTREAYETIFATVCAEKHISLPDDIVPMLMDEFYSKGDIPMACYHPRWIVDQVLARCEYEGLAPQLSAEFVRDSFSNLYVRSDNRHPD